MEDGRKRAVRALYGTPLALRLVLKYAPRVAAKPKKLRKIVDCSVFEDEELDRRARQYSYNFV